MIKRSKFLFSLQQINKIFPRIKSKISKVSQYRKRIDEWNLIKKFYGNRCFQKRTFLKKYLHLKKSGSKSAEKSEKQETFFHFIESRLDVVLYRSGFFESIVVAKQQIAIGFIEVNGKKVVSPKYILQPGDIISVLCAHKNKIFCCEICKIENQESKKMATRKNLSGSRFKKSTGVISLINNNIPAFQLNASFERSSKKQEKSIDFLMSIFFDKISVFLNSLMVFSQDGKFRDLEQTQLDFFPSPSRSVKWSSCSKSKQYDSYGVGSVLDTSKSKIGYKWFGKKNLEQNFFLSTLCKQKLLCFLEDKKLKHKNRCFSLDKLKMSKLQQKQWLDKLDHSFKSSDSTLQSNHCAPFVISCRSKTDKHESHLFINNWLFSTYYLFLKKRNVCSLKRKSMLFANKQQQKNKTFWSNQSFFVSKKTKPLHLEISYKTRSIIFLFPPQRICLPKYINIASAFTS